MAHDQTARPLPTTAPPLNHSPLLSMLANKTIQGLYVNIYSFHVYVSVCYVSLLEALLTAVFVTQTSLLAECHLIKQAGNDQHQARLDTDLLMRRSGLQAGKKPCSPVARGHDTPQGLETHHFSY